MAILKRTGYDLHYEYLEADKNGPTLIFIHELGLDSRIWDGFLPYVDQRLNLLTYDFFGHGLTTDSRSPLSLRLLSEELIALIRHLHLKRVHLVGCRFGAVFALQMPAIAPDLIESLILMSVPLLVNKNSYDQEAATNVQLFELDRLLYEKKYILESLYPVTFSKSRVISHGLQRVTRENYLSLVNELIEINHRPDFDLLSKLKKLEIPVLFMHGEYDPVFPAGPAMILSNYVPNSRFMVIPDASALIPLDQPQIAARLINHFILSDKTPSLPASNGPSFIDAFKKVFEQAYQPRHIHPRHLRMSIMSGKVRVFWNGKEIYGEWNQRNAKELLLYLILNQGAVKRDVLIDAFERDSDLNQARNQLRVQLSHLNKIFHNQPDESVHSLIIATRDSLALNADVQSDIGDYMHDVEELLWSDDSLFDRADGFLRILEDFHPEAFHSFRSDWSRSLVENVKSKLAQIMAQLLIALHEDDDLPVMRKILKAGKKVEPYKGFCREWLQAIKQR
ncbi:alpha/beta hydrolase [Sporolactobacillus sp. THM7-4]|nr:alpha/beta hydrolase [Sporolactobacillus sp. THM7-4]